MQQGGQESTFSDSGLDDAEQSDDDHKEHDAQSNGCLAKNLVPSAGLALAEEGVGSAGDGAGETLVLAGLHENGHDQTKGNQTQREGENNLNQRH